MGKLLRARLRPSHLQTAQRFCRSPFCLRTQLRVPQPGTTTTEFITSLEEVRPWGSKPNPNHLSPSSVPNLTS